MIINPTSTDIILPECKESGESFNPNSPFKIYLNPSSLSFIKCTVVQFSSNAGDVNDYANTILVGTFNMTQTDWDLIKSRNIKNYSQLTISRESRQDICDTLMKEARHLSPFHVHVNANVLSPGGFTLRELLYFLQRLNVLPLLSSASVTCNDPFTAGKIVAEISK